MTDNPRVDELRRRVQQDPTSIAFAALAEEYRRAGQYEEAVEVCRNGLNRHPQYLSARVTLGRALIELDQLDEAKMELDQVLSLAPENLAATRALAEIHARLGGGSPEASPAPEVAAAPTSSAAFELDLVPAAAAPATAEADHTSPPELEPLTQLLDAVVALKSHSA